MIGVLRVKRRIRIYDKGNYDIVRQKCICADKPALSLLTHETSTEICALAFFVHRLTLCFGNFYNIFYRLLIIFKIIFFQEYHLGIKQIEPRSGPTFGHLMGLIHVQSVRKCYQQTTLECKELLSCQPRVALTYYFFFCNC